jgi:uncharacterized protein (UPF0548 family)
MRWRSKLGLAGSYPSCAIISVATIVKLAPVSSTTGITREDVPSAASSRGQRQWKRGRDHKLPWALKDNSGIRRQTAGEMNAEVSRVLLKGTMNFVAILAVGEHSTFAKGSRSIQLVIFEEKPLIRVFSFYFLSAE